MSSEGVVPQPPTTVDEILKSIGFYINDKGELIATSDKTYLKRARILNKNLEVILG